ncbi:hypothetical protein GF312_10980 [Candidatus Poribacteria bacterium]|nr:hypothetical protein [Candidatus Poribacteria bacterium]
MYVLVKEPISVVAIFSSGKIIPRFFIWKKRKYSIEEVTYLWRTKIGSVPIIHFSVTTEKTFYEISYNLKSFNWQLEKLYVA